MLLLLITHHKIWGNKFIAETQSHTHTHMFKVIQLPLVITKYFIFFKTTDTHTNIT